ncbi:MAG: hypothetical protein B7Z81_15415 [Acidocella sp. 20-61-6]|nr:MAG: hypothetical protein B7Z81_15415 [Acidocella sp. 20-61-6]
MPVLYAQGDIFEVGYNDGYEFLLVFGHIGINEMREKWHRFRERFDTLRQIQDPFNQLEKPLQFATGRWIQFVSERENHGIGFSELAKIIDDTFKWTVTQGLKTVITNGVRDIDHGRTTVQNIASDNRRVRELSDLLEKKSHGFEKIMLVSLNDAYIRSTPV